MELFKVFGSIMISDEGAIKTLKDADKQAKESAKALDKVKDTATKVGKAMVVGIGAAVTSLGAMALKSAEATDRIDKMSQKLGLSRKAFQEWDYVMSQNGISIDSMQGGMNKLNNVMDDFRNGNKTATDAMDRLGISMEAIDGKSQEEVFSMVINQLQGMENESERAAIANDLLGRSASELAPMLNAGADSAEQLKARAHELGLVLDDETINAGVIFGDTLDDMKKSMGTMVTQIGAEVMPIFQKMLDWVLEHMPTIKEIASNVFEAIGNTIQWLSDNANWLIPVLGGMLGAFLALKVIGAINTLMLAFQAVQTAVAAAGGIMNAVLAANPLGLIALAIGVVITAIILLVKNFDAVKEAAQKLWQNFKDIFGKIRDFVGGIFNNFRNIIKLPKFEVSGSLNPVTWLKNGLPKLKVKWNADGAIFDSPTIFGTQYGYQGVGEAGPEAIMPISKLQDMVDFNKSEIDYKQLARELKIALLGLNVVLDNGVLVGELTPGINKQLGLDSDRRKRGW